MTLPAIAQRHISVELGGSGGLGSLNYEKTLSKKDNLTLVFRTGFSVAPVDKNNGNALIFPQMVHTIYGKTKHYADFGIGLAPSFTTKLGGAFVRMPISLGYRVMPEDKKYYFRISYTPLVSFLFDWQWQQWAGFTFGFKLNQSKTQE